MRTATYESVLHGVAATAGIDPANILAHEKTLLGEYINTAVKLCWDYYPWQEFTHTEKRYFRDEWSASNVYAQGDEVFYDGKYYKVWASLAGNPTGAPDSDSSWYEVGDLSDSFVWSETGLYYVGARVSYQDKDYLCIAQPDGTTASGVDPVNFEYDGILPTNGIYFREIPEGFERYIGYEQTGKSVIGTVLSIHKTDPRYSTSPPVNFREGREGIYIDGHEVLNEVWLRYREEAPEFDPLATTDSRIPKFLVPAIKCFAYKAWLIGDGQHEKSVIQDVMGYDLLVKELDRLDLQQERGQPYRITREPYRRINSQQPHVIERTKDQVAALKSAAVNTVIKVLTNGLAKNAVVTGAVVASAAIGATCEATNAVKTAGSWVQGQEAIEGRYLIFPNGYERPDGTGERFPANTFFQITAVNTNGSPPYDIEYKATWVDASGNIQSQTQAIMDAQHGQRGSFWETYGRNDFSSTSRISASANGQDIVKEASVTCSILAFTGTPFRGIGIGFVGGEETTVHEVTVNPSVIDESTPLSDDSIWNVLEVGDRVGWKALNTSGANLIVNGSQAPQSVGSAILSNLLYPKNVGAVVNTYQGTGIVQVDFKYNGNTYGWRFTQAGYNNFYLVTADDTILLGCGATAEVDGEQKSTVNLSVGTYMYACKEASRTVSQTPLAIRFAPQPNGGDVIGKNAIKTSYVAGSQSKYPFAKSGYYPLWETNQDAVDYNDDWGRGSNYLYSVGSLQVGVTSYYRAGVWGNEYLNLPIYDGNYTGTPPAPPAITVEVTAAESNALSAYATLACSVTTSVDGSVGNIVEAQASLSYSISSGSSRPNYVSQRLFTERVLRGDGQSGNSWTGSILHFSAYDSTTSGIDKASYIDPRNALSATHGAGLYTAYTKSELSNKNFANLSATVTVFGNHTNDDVFLVSDDFCPIVHLLSTQNPVTSHCKIAFKFKEHNSFSTDLEMYVIYDDADGNTIMQEVAQYTSYMSGQGGTSISKIDLAYQTHTSSGKLTKTVQSFSGLYQSSSIITQATSVGFSGMANVSWTEATASVAKGQFWELRKGSSDSDTSDPWSATDTFYALPWGYNASNSKYDAADLYKLIPDEWIDEKPVMFSSREEADPSTGYTTNTTYTPQSMKHLKSSDTVHAEKS